MRIRIRNPGGEPPPPPAHSLFPPSSLTVFAFTVLYVGNLVEGEIPSKYKQMTLRYTPPWSNY
jgi:hypothetical protein